MVRVFHWQVLFAGGALLLTATAAAAQSAIAGVVRDTSGAALPGVIVEVASPALIERARVATTDGNGGYRITDLRPGSYTVTATLTGFNTYRREGIELPADFTATINVELQVGTLEETVTVTGASPVVDVASAARIQNLDREALDTLPTGRSIYSMGQLVPGVNLNQPDVGGSRAMQQTYMSTRGLTSANNIVQVDGMMINGLDGDGAVQQYINNAFIQEMSYQTAGAGADVSPGGVRVNIVARDGGNTYSGSFFGAWSDGAWQSDNFSDYLRARGLRSVDKIVKIWDFNLGIGGPIKRDRLWFYGSARHWGVHAPIAGTFVVPSGATVNDCQAGRVACGQGVDDQQIKSAVLRLTWQASPRNKLSIYFDEIDKYRGHGMGAGVDVATASQIWTSPLYNDGVLKWTSPVTSQLLLEAGFAINYEQYVIKNQDGVNQERGTAAWYAGASRTDIATGTLWNGFGSGQGGRYPDRFTLGSSASYVTAAHNVKVGFQWTWGPYENTRETNADLQQVYNNGVPLRVNIFNTPLRYLDRLVADLGLYAQDSWSLDRLTLNYGVRWEYHNSEVAEEASPAGRFQPDRKYGPIKMPIWKDFAPRFGAIYDLFGDARTAVKFSYNRYNESRTTFFANRYNPLAIQSFALPWTDVNGDDIAQGELGCVFLTPGCEINFATLPTTFGQPRLNTVDPNFKRVYNLETAVGVQHELISRLSVSTNYYRRSFHNLRVTDNLLRTMADYQPYNLFHPITGQPFQVWDVLPAAAPRVQNFDTNSDGRSHIYHGVDLTINGRLPRGATVFGGFVTERNLRNICDEPDDPNMLLYCDDAQNGIPWRPTFKLSGTVPLAWGLSLSATWQDLAGRPLGLTTTAGNKISGPGYGDTGSPVGTNWQITNTGRYPADCPAPCPAGQLIFPAGAPRLTSASVTVPLVAPGTEFLPRVRQLDLSVQKSFRVGRSRLQGQLDVFNVGNSNAVAAVASTLYGTAAYNRPASVLQGRMLRLGMQVKW
jgi:hypothetical protein